MKRLLFVAVVLGILLDSCAHQQPKPDPTPCHFMQADGGFNMKCDNSAVPIAEK